MNMIDWIKKLASFLQFNEENILTHAGKISHQMALDHSEKEFEKFELNLRQIDASQLPSLDYAIHAPDHGSKFVSDNDGHEFILNKIPFSL